MDLSIFQQRMEAIEARIFYDAQESSANYQKKYFPMFDGEKSTEYSRRPKLAVPISSAICNRVIDVLSSGIKLTSDEPTTLDTLQYVEENWALHDQIRQTITNTIVGGMDLSIVHYGGFVQHWEAEYAVNYGGGLVGYTFFVEDGQLKPVLKADQKNQVTVLIDEYLWGEMPHFLGFNPASITLNIDKYRSGNEGRSFIQRWLPMAIEFDQVFSSVSQQLKVLKNIWATNRDFVNEELDPISLTPGRIVSLGPDGKLEQIVRNLNLTEEREHLLALERHIARASNVPGEFSGLSDIGKLPSGVALSILLKPLQELLERFAITFQASAKNLARRLVMMKNVMNNNLPGDPQITATITPQIFSKSREAEVNEIITLKKEGIITPEEARTLILPFLDLPNEA